MSFKEQLKKDLDVFFNTDEFGEQKTICYQQKTYNIPVVFERDVETARKQSSSDHGDGIFLIDARLHLKKSDFNVVPRQGRIIEVGNESFKIVKTSSDLGVVVIDLEMFDE